ncbi:CPXCG motif-containing cysteine-rich protein [Pseudoalteromonas sp. S327]|uniref:CPXCG motif-containing cysteine-rich protein n=1 Tax=Pseudoalteromonas TaxID=53246 RepID=UPI00110BBC31|nr:MULTISPECIES: CPXCG motif-containing cysteine-rich protein [unclassified Pseudoalteromonas]TMO08485.1 CPXCG motif-containing cysteine-rich protein [Pseudoalteromonas sp. S327]TMO20305.1 CPXCG motif-containing cysteine-rich protein [Pseudoalteromonas sp. S326]
MNQLTEKSISCPYCGESIEVLLDAADIGEQYIEDCQVCCKPISFVVFEDEDELKVNVYSENDTF